MAEQVDGLKRVLGARYGEGVAVEYVDTYSPKMLAGHPDVLRLIVTRQVTLPVVSIGGKPRFAGGISEPLISETLEKLGLRPIDTASA